MEWLVKIPCLPFLLCDSVQGFMSQRCASHRPVHRCLRAKKKKNPNHKRCQPSAANVRRWENPASQRTHRVTPRNAELRWEGQSRGALLRGRFCRRLGSTSPLPPPPPPQTPELESSLLAAAVSPLLRRLAIGEERAREEEGDGIYGMVVPTRRRWQQEKRAFKRAGAK